MPVLNNTTFSETNFAEALWDSGDGKVIAKGAHPIVVLRAADGRAESLRKGQKTAAALADGATEPNLLDT